jgi:integration host factor subunit alpha
MALNGKTLTRADLAEAVFEKVGLPRNEAAELVESVLKQIVYALERGEAIKLSSFGSFGLRQKSERVGRNPKTGEVVPITPRQVIVFKASNIMKDRINATLSKPVKPAEAEKPAAGGKSAKSPKAGKSAKPSKVEKPAKPAKATKPGNSAKPPKSNSEKKPAPSSRRDA